MEPKEKQRYPSFHLNYFTNSIDGPRNFILDTGGLTPGGTNQGERLVGGSWQVDETFIKVRGQLMDLYRAVDGPSNTVEFCLS